MKKLLVCLTLISLLGAVRAQVASVSYSGMEESRLTFTTPAMTVETMTVDGQVYSQLRMADFAPQAPAGEPSLPVYSRTIEIPVCSQVRVEVVSAQVNTVSAASLGVTGLWAPQQPSRSKSDTSSAVWVRSMERYATDAFCGGPVVQVHRLGVSRDRHLAVVSYSPVRYNPVTGMVELYSQVEVVLHYDGADISATRELRRRYYSEAFAPQTDLLVTLPMSKLDYASSAPVRYLIVSHSSFRDYLDDFVNWKRRKGFLTDIVYTDYLDVGTTTTTIAAFIKSQYTNATEENPAPTYVLLVGDVEQIPAFAANNQLDNDHITDLYYATWTDGDYLPDCYYGRFSAQNVEQLIPQIEKTLLYEQYNFADPTYLSKAILVAGVDRGSSSDNAYRYGDPAMDYAAKEYCKAANGYSSVVYYKNNTSFTPTGVTVTGSSNSSATETALRALYNEGAGWVNYTAHGSEESWATPSLQISHVNQMSNSGKPMFMIGNCCLTNHFNTVNCFGEALLRRGNNAGAVAYIGGSNSTYWQEDFCWSVGVRSNISNTMDANYDASHLGAYDRLFHTHGESAPTWRTSAGAIISAGNMAVQELNASSTSVKYYWEIYHVMGDPSLEPWLGEADVMPLTVSAVHYRGGAPLHVTAVPYAYVALTDGNGTLIAAAFADAQGVADLALPSTLSLGQYELAATAQNYQPAFRNVRIISPSGSALAITGLTADAPLVAGDTVTFTVQVANYSEVASGAFALRCVSTDLTQIFMLDNVESLPGVAGNDTLVTAAAFSAVVNPAAIDNGRIRINVLLIEGSDTSVFSTQVIVQAPNPEVEGYTLSSPVEPGQTITVSVMVRNNGHAPVTDATLSLQHSYSTATVLTAPYTHQSIAEGQSLTVAFDVTFAADLLPSASIPFLFGMNYSGGTRSHTIALSYAHVTLVDFETGDMSQINPSMNSRPWVIDSDVAYEGQYSARSARSLGSRGSSSMTINYTTEYADSVRFFAKVSSEADCDIFTFSIDGTEQLSLSGEVDWTRYAFPLPAGSHTFVFKYQKDWWGTSGSDAAWVDNIMLPAPIVPVVYLTDTVCQFSEYTFMDEPVSTENLGVFMLVDSSESQITFLSLTVLPLPELTIVASSEEVPAGTPVSLSVSGASRYEWSTGEQSSSIYVAPQTTTTYSVTGYNGTCSATAEVTIRVVSGIDNVADASLRIYPNPASDWVNVELPSLRRLTVFDAAGRTMTMLEGVADAVRFSVKDWAKGLYILRIETADATYHRHVVLR